ncbi:MAG: WD40 repeat domain-containing protein [Sulfurimonas sp.]|uniref:WD40 repeat domain-containing protein n=1 Tax=Sulfurimonas sp. TaxID=2022749 RepID=UPI00260788E6|nr:WD40 repeat domain-containing protein [Sulfurimonas sp.]MDD3475872.1 WD40 repeat domain-containing protein [Sulfurimonas sp.]
MKLFLIFAFLLSSLLATTIKEPIAHFVASGSVVDMLYKDGKLYCATDASSVDIFDFETKKLINKIEVKKILDFMGETIDSKVYSVDAIEDKILLLSQDKNGFRRVHIYQNGVLRVLFDYSKGLTVAKAKFLDANTLLLALLSNELISYDIAKNSQNYSIQVSGAKFSDFVLNEERSEVVVADESGNLKIHSTKDGLFLKLLADQNLDNVFQVDYKKGIIATAGQDRRMVIYAPKFNSAYYSESKFLIYSVGLSPSGKIVGYASDENNNVTLQNTITKANLGKFGGNKMTLSKILFISENDFLVGSDDKVVNQYSIK